MIWLVCSVIGGVIVALPDRGPRLVSISEAHGPSRVDAVGIVFLIGGWLVYLSALVHHRDRIEHAMTRRARAATTFALGLGIGLVVASVANDFPYWWIIGALILMTVQLLLVPRMVRRSRPASGSTSSRA